MPKLTKSYVDALRARDKRYAVKDTGLPGFEIRVNTDGTKTAALRYFRDGRVRRVTLGKLCEGYTFAKAREAACKVLGEVKAGGDPASERERARAMPTFEAVAERFMAEHAGPFCKPRTVSGYECLLRVHLLPALGKMRIHEIERSDVERVHRKMGETVPGAANRGLTLISSIMTRAETWGYRPMRSNPCYRLRRFRENKCERFLSPEERARLEDVLAVAERAPKGHADYVAPGNIDAIRLLSHTGARKGEIVGLQWSMVDLERAAPALRLPDSKTGAKVIPLSPPAVALLRRLKDANQSGSPWVCQSETGDRLHHLGRAWLILRHRAKLDDVRLHDLRHSAASDALAAGVPLALVGAMLGHKSPQTTARYTHLADGTLQEAARMMGERIEKNTREGAERQARAVGDEQGEREASEGASAIPMDGGKVIRFPGKRR